MKRLFGYQIVLLFLLSGCTQADNAAERDGETAVPAMETAPVEADAAAPAVLTPTESAPATESPPEEVDTAGPADSQLAPTETASATEAVPQLSTFTQGSIEPGEAKAFSFQASSGEEIVYWLHLPVEYEDSRTWPLILSLHGFLGFEPRLEAVLEQSPVAYVRPEVEFPFVVISPRAPDGPWAIYHEPMEELIDFLSESLAISPDSQFLLGLSTGAIGAWQWALAFPDRFAGMALNSGTPSLNPNDPVSEDICLLKDLPIWVAGSEADERVEIEPNRQVVLALEECGSTVASLIVYPDLDHLDAISTAYEGPELYEWLLTLAD
jgi:predicted peptidase